MRKNIILRISVADLNLLLKLISKRSLDTHLLVKLESGQAQFTFSDVDRQVVTATLYEVDAGYKARVTSSESLETLCKQLK